MLGWKSVLKWLSDEAVTGSKDVLYENWHELIEQLVIVKLFNTMNSAMGGGSHWAHVTASPDSFTPVTCSSDTGTTAGFMPFYTPPSPGVCLWRLCWETRQTLWLTGLQLPPFATSRDNKTNRRTTQEAQKETASRTCCHFYLQQNR